jgi:hypothetical protein
VIQPIDQFVAIAVDRTSVHTTDAAKLITLAAYEGASVWANIGVDALNAIAIRVGVRRRWWRWRWRWGHHPGLCSDFRLRSVIFGGCGKIIGLNNLSDAGVARANDQYCCKRYRNNSNKDE